MHNTVNIEGDKLRIEQLSFLEPVEKPIKKHENKFSIKYDATICSMCCCDKCKYSVEIDPFLSTEECKTIKERCFNCDECYYYGMDNENLSRNKVKFKCDKFEMSNYYSERAAKAKRRNFKIIGRDKL